MAFDHRRGCLVLALTGLVFSTGGVLLQEPLLSSSLKGSDEISIFLPVYAYLFLLNPLTFYLNMLSVLLHVMKHAAGAPEAHVPIFSLSHLPRATHVVSFFTRLLGLPLWIQAAVTEESIGFAIGAMLVCITSVSILASVFKKILISSCHAGRGFVPALLALSISTGFLIFIYPILSLSNTNYPLVHTALHLLLFFVIFIIFILGITLLILRISSPAEIPQAAIEAEHLAIFSLSVVYAILLVDVYMMAYVAITNMAVVDVEAAEK